MQLSVVRNLILKGSSDWFPVSGLLVIDAVGWQSMYHDVMPRVNLIVILSIYARYLYSINWPTIICLPSMSLFILWRDTTSELWTPVQFPLYYSHLFTLLALFTFSHITIAFHSIRSFLFLQLTSEIDNLIVSWEQSIWLCCVQVQRCSWQSKALDEAPYKLSGAVVKLASITFLSLAFSWIRQTFISYWGKNLLLCSSYLPLGVPNWTVIYINTSCRIKTLFWHHCQGKRRLLQGEFRTHILYFVLSFALLYFYLYRFIKNTKN
jgi:hypothetical protein